MKKEDENKFLNLNYKDLIKEDSYWKFGNNINNIEEYFFKFINPPNKRILLFEFRNKENCINLEKTFMINKLREIFKI